MKATALVTERNWVKAVKHLARRSTEWRIAVGYCGEHAYMFFPESPAQWTTDFRVVVDASPGTVKRGLTNPMGVGRLVGMGARVKSVPGLHSKVLCFGNAGAIVGSANLSESAISQQRQCGLHVSEPAAVKQVRSWFNALWNESSELLDSGRLNERQKLFPKNAAPGGPSKGVNRLPVWKGRPPEAPLPPADFSFGISKSALKETLKRFAATSCAYHDDGRTCEQTAGNNERWYGDESRAFHSLYKRRHSWDAGCLEELFRKAFLNGRAALMFVNQFRQLPPARVAETVEFLLEGPGDPFVRLEQVLDGKPHRIPRIGIAGWACLMHLWDPTQFAIFNDPVFKALRRLKVRAGRAQSHRVAAKYRNLCEAMRELTRICGLKNLSRADHFFDGIGKGHFRVARNLSLGGIVGEV